MRCTHKRHRGSAEAGITLLEVLIAISLLGVSFGAILSGLSAALRATDRLGHYESVVDYAQEKLNELVLDPSVTAGQQRFGASSTGIRWQATTQSVETRPLSGPDRPVQLVRIILQVSWSTPHGAEGFTLRTLKLCMPEPPASP